MESGVNIVAASKDDAERLADIRVEAMRPSLEAVGRFDPERARRRFLDTFSPDETKIIKLDGEIAGFFVLRPRLDHLHLDHLYFRTRHQGKGMGRAILDQIKREARRRSLPVRLTALRESPSNAFYRTNGFRLVASEEFDNHYEWRP